MIWIDVFVLCPLGEVGSASLPNNPSVGPYGHPFLFGRPSVITLFLLEPAPFCKLSVGYNSTNKSATFLLFSFSLTLALFLLYFPFLYPSFFFSVYDTPGKNFPFSLSPFLPGFNGSTVTHFFQVIPWPMSWPEEMRCFSHL